VELQIEKGITMRELVSSLDWSRTPLGPTASWPQSLRTVVGILLTSRYAMWMAWGPELTFLYNDTYGQVTLGKKHPWALGKPAKQVWKEIWSEIGPRIQRVLDTGQSTWDEGLLLFLERCQGRSKSGPVWRSKREPLGALGLPGARACGA